ncbi:MAG TPA: EboA domain-containing protein [Povalibacter sp.]|uniref:EboA domain-containing protein n=1 Tax=Povalibacter sp. TaxID=1962978 RepID=UPI002BB73D58|nr:EboA domain-containing protein [Povalibacter sp.]HMN43059.1 EboA domain-containing protein [Povalibacter sp.]
MKSQTPLATPPSPAARLAILQQLLQPRLSADAGNFVVKAVAEIRSGTDPTRFSQLIASASRHARRRIAFDPTPEELALAGSVQMDVNIVAWNQLEALRVLLVLSHPDLEQPAFVEALEQCFRYADEGELCALYRALPLLPDGARFTWRAGEGCRSNMRSVFEAVACDSQFPARHFDDVAWRQLVMKAVFLNAPLWRVHGLDSRLSPELARMALDFIDERRSAGRPIPPQLWLCLGTHEEDRSLHALRTELRRGDLRGRSAALLALARAGQLAKVHQWLGGWLGDLEPTLAQAQHGDTTQLAFRDLWTTSG